MDLRPLTTAQRHALWRQATLLLPADLTPATPQAAAPSVALPVTARVGAFFYVAYLGLWFVLAMIAASGGPP